MAELPPECKTNSSGGVPALTQNTDADGVGPQPATLGGEPACAQMFVRNDGSV
jgi:hypothetical protein